MKGIHKRHIIILGLIGAIIFVLLFRAVNSYYEFLSSKQPVSYGVTFTPRYAAYLGLDPKVTYHHLLEHVGVRKIRLAAYWDQDLSGLDYYINEAAKHQASVILAIGYKLPRWPECYGPAGTSGSEAAPEGRASYRPEEFTEEQLQAHLLEIIQRYENNPTIVAWQVENEFNFPFGECTVKRTQKEFKAEIDFVRAHSQKNIVLTDAGEFSYWVFAMQNSDIFGTTLYRDAYFPPVGHIFYPFPSWFYRLRIDLYHKFLAPNNLKTIIVELQAESWNAEGVLATPLDAQVALFPASQLTENAQYAQMTGVDEIYLWGAEWWYYMAAHGYPEYVSAASKLFEP